MLERKETKAETELKMGCCMDKLVGKRERFDEVFFGTSIYDRLSLYL